MSTVPNTASITQRLQLNKKPNFLNFNLNLLQDFGCLECQNFA